MFYKMEVKNGWVLYKGVEGLNWGVKVINRSLPSFIKYISFEFLTF